MPVFKKIRTIYSQDNVLPLKLNNIIIVGPEKRGITADNVFKITFINILEALK